MAKEIRIRKIMMSNDVDRNLMELRNFGDCPNPQEEDFYGEIVMWLSYETPNNSVPIPYWITEGRDYVHPNIVLNNITGITSEISKVGDNSLWLHTDNQIKGHLDDMSYDTHVAMRGRYGTWFHIQKNAGYDIFGLLQIYEGVGEEIPKGFLFCYDNESDNFQTTLYSNSIIYDIDFDWSPGEDHWYFIEFAYDLYNNFIGFYVSDDDNQNIYSYERTDIPDIESKFKTLTIAPKGDSNTSTIYLDNTILSTDPMKSLYPIRNSTWCPKGPKIINPRNVDIDVYLTNRNIDIYNPTVFNTTDWFLYWRCDTNIGQTSLIFDNNSGDYSRYSSARISYGSNNFSSTNQRIGNACINSSAGRQARLSNLVDTSQHGFIADKFRIGFYMYTGENSDSTSAGATIVGTGLLWSTPTYYFTLVFSNSFSDHLQFLMYRGNPWGSEMATFNCSSIAPDTYYWIEMSLDCVGRVYRLWIENVEIPSETPSGYGPPVGIDIAPTSVLMFGSFDAPLDISYIDNFMMSLDADTSLWEYRNMESFPR